MYIGRIISKFKKHDTIDFVEVTSDVSKIDSYTLTLIVGKELAEEIYGKDTIKVLNRNISKNVMWTYAKNERRNEYEHDLLKFNKMIIKELYENIKYSFFNIYTESLTNIKKFISFMESDKEKYIFLSENHMYINYNRYVVGLSIEQIEYSGVNITKLINKIKANKYNIFIENSNFISLKLKNEIKDNKILIPYLYSIVK